ILRQPPPSFVSTMEEYIKEAPISRNDVKRLEYHENDQSPKKGPEQKETEEPEAVEEVKEEEHVEQVEEQVEEVAELPPLISTDGDDDLLGLNEINPKAQELEDLNALALAILPPGGGKNSNSLALANLSGTTGWELALVTTPSNHTSQAPGRIMAGGFDKLLLDSLYDDENARRQLQLQNAGYGYGGTATTIHNPFDNYSHQDPFALSNNIAPPSNVQMASMAQQQHMMFQQHQQQHSIMMAPYQQQNPLTQYPQQMPVMSSFNPFGDPLPVPSYSYSPMHHHQGNYNIL
ncbi:hypothetical protein RYX36_027665, partial [Vicia faba]